MKECNLKNKTKIHEKRGCLPKCKTVFYGQFFFVFWWFCFFVACVFVLLLGPKRLFSFNLEFLFLFSSPKRPVLKCLFSSFSVFFLVLLMSSLSKFHLFSLLFVHQPLFAKDSFEGFLQSFIILLPFPFLVFASFFETNFLTSPF